MHRVPLVAGLLLALTVAGCRATTPEMAKDARDVQISVEEADRAFLYSAADTQRVLELVRPAQEQKEGVRLYRYRRDTRELEEIVGEDFAPDRPTGNEALIALSPETHGASINLWNWIEGDITRLSLRLDGLSARPVETPGEDGQGYEVVFTAREPAIFPFCRDKDYEIFKALLVSPPDGGAAELLEFQQLTHNNWDDSQPAFSPDGLWVVFVSEELGPKNIALMDSNGDFLRLLTRSTQRNSFYPVVLPNNEECLYASEVGGISEFFICGLDGQGHRRASGQELKKMLFSWDDSTRHAYLLTEVFTGEKTLRLLLDLPPKVDFIDLVILGEWNSPALKQCREKIRAARAARRASQQGRGAKVDVRATHMLEVGVLTDEPEQSPFDRPVEAFTRVLFTLSLPLFRGSLDRAIAQRDMWQEVVYSQTYRKGYDALLDRVALEYYNYSEQTARAAVLRRILDANRKRRFLWETRVAAGKELPGRAAEAEGYIGETEANLAAALGAAKAARSRLCAALGLNDVQSIQIQPAPMNWEELPARVPPAEEFQALAQLNHPELARLKFLELRAAAVRDMGPPSSRARPTLELTYGPGFQDFSELADDFISMTVAHALPLDALGSRKPYREQWTHEMLAYRRERQQARLDVNAALQGTHAALLRVCGQFAAARKWRDFMAEEVRLSRVYASHGVLADNEPQDVVDQIEAEISHLKQQLVLIGLRGEFCRHLAHYYCRAGMGRKLIDVLGQKPQAQTDRQRSVWLWQSLEVVLSPEKRDQLLRLCQEQGITRIYCFVSRVENELYLQKHAWEFGHFIDQCGYKGIEVYALVGNPQWIEVSYRPEIGALVRSIVEFNARTQEGLGGFVGLKLDVEPHALPGWKDDASRVRLVSGYLDMLEHVRASLGKDGAGLALTADVPYTYADVRAPGEGDAALFDIVCSRLEEVTVMAYLNNPDDIVRKLMPLLQTAQKHGIKVEVGIQTAPDEARGTSFSGRSVEEVVVALDQVYDRLARFESFAGFAIHDYSGFALLVEKQHAH